MSDLLPVRWLCGPSGVGKSTVGGDYFTGLPDAGYVDIDQLGMCFPTLPSDPGRTVLQARILDRVVTAFGAAGAACLVVSGYVDSRRGVHTECLPHAALDVLRLRCDQPELRRRLVTRARGGDQWEAGLGDAEILDRSGLSYPCLDTTALTTAEVLHRVRDRWPVPPSREPTPWPVPEPTPGEILWLYGAPAVGKSTIGWEVGESSRRAGHTTGFVDLQQIGFRHPAPAADPDDHRLKAANLAAVWAGFHTYGARRLVVVGRVEREEDVRLYAKALPAATLTLCRLDAGPAELRERFRLRGLGGGPQIAGDELRGRPVAELDAAHEVAVAQAGRLWRAGLGDVHVDTDGRSVDDLAGEIVDKCGW